MSTAYPNRPTAIRHTYLTENLSWWLVLLFLPARLALALGAQGLTATVLAINDSSSAWVEAAAWWPLYSTVTDVMCLISLVWLTRREGLSLPDLIGVKDKAALKELARAPAYLLVIAPAAFVASLVTRSFYGSTPPPFFTDVPLPPVAAPYAIIIWPVVWVIAEDLLCLGYLLSRIEAWSGKTRLAVRIVVFFWGFEHLAIPIIGDPTYLLSRVLAAWAATGGITLIFVLWRRRIVPIMGAHSIFNLATALLV